MCTVHETTYSTGIDEAPVHCKTKSSDPKAHATLVALLTSSFLKVHSADMTKNQQWRFRLQFLVYLLIAFDLSNSLLSTSISCRRHDCVTTRSLQLFDSHELSRRNLPGSCIKPFLLSPLTGSFFQPPVANAVKTPTIFRERKQLDLCLVTLLRVRFWAEANGLKFRHLLEEKLNGSAILLDSNRLNQVKSIYLETRLGCKALLTAKIGGGANLRVLTLATFELKECVNDLRYWYRNVQIDSTTDSKLIRSMFEKASEDIIESIANIVEFDGLETTQDPSPRSSLALKMFSLDKAVFVQRILLERVVPSCDSIINLFGATRRLACENFVRLNYPDEVSRLDAVTTTP